LVHYAWINISCDSKWQPRDALSATEHLLPNGTAVIGDFLLLWLKQFFLRYVSIIKVDVGVSVCGSHNLAESEDKSLKFWQLF
jgi:hypothetical protein